MKFKKGDMVVHRDLWKNPVNGNFSKGVIGGIINDCNTFKYEFISSKDSNIISNIDTSVVDEYYVMDKEQIRSDNLKKLL